MRKCIHFKIVSLVEKGPVWIRLEKIQNKLKFVQKNHFFFLNCKKMYVIHIGIEHLKEIIKKPQITMTFMAMMSGYKRLSTALHKVVHFKLLENMHFVVQKYYYF